MEAAARQRHGALSTAEMEAAARQRHSARIPVRRHAAGQRAEGAPVAPSRRSSSVPRRPLPPWPPPRGTVRVGWAKRLVEEERKQFTEMMRLSGPSQPFRSGSPRIAPLQRQTADLCYDHSGSLARKDNLRWGMPANGFHHNAAGRVVFGSGKQRWARPAATPAGGSADAYVPKGMVEAVLSDGRTGCPAFRSQSPRMCLKQQASSARASDWHTPIQIGFKPVRH
eukprot:TRINITY_DN6614_c0_g1_i1.p1 TRINITY_DN6614_c0_g1~~TRINITY_DN6614_c0_g1_i1.p1  ORF type:complete len:242 (+),score=51.16 TRINITY_DN6614_c0_g1_i1:52-726(+)